MISILHYEEKYKPLPHNGNPCPIQHLLHLKTQLLAYFANFFLFFPIYLTYPTDTFRRFRWPRGLRRGFPTARLLGLWVRVPPETRTSECCVLSGRGLCDELITRPEESHRL